MASLQFDLEQAGTQNLTDLSSKVDVTKYLTSTSDIVSLMTIEHQARMTNLITGVSQQFRRASGNGTLESSNDSLDRAADQLVEYMLYADEAPMRDPVRLGSRTPERPANSATQPPHARKHSIPRHVATSLATFGIHKEHHRCGHQRRGDAHPHCATSADCMTIAGP